MLFGGGYFPVRVLRSAPPGMRVQSCRQEECISGRRHGAYCAHHRTNTSRHYTYYSEVWQSPCLCSLRAGSSQPLRSHRLVRAASSFSVCQRGHLSGLQEEESGFSVSLFWVKVVLWGSSTGDPLEWAVYLRPVRVLCAGGRPDSHFFLGSPGSVPLTFLCNR
jgi:hypothetical protein